MLLEVSKNLFSNQPQLGQARNFKNLLDSFLIYLMIISWLQIWIVFIERKASSLTLTGIFISLTSASFFIQRALQLSLFKFKKLLISKTPQRLQIDLKTRSNSI